MSVVIETTIGDFTIDLLINERPRTSMNFLKLCKVKYYNFCLFHKIEKDFIAQSGDPTGTGRGGESVFYQLYGEQGKYFEGELKPKIKHRKIGFVSMVNGGGDGGVPMHGSQFFITLGDNLDYLDQARHTVFGEVVEGLDVIYKLNETICDDESRPYKDIMISHTVILDDPFPDPSNLDIPLSPEINEQFFQSNRIGVNEDIDENEGKTTEEIEEEIRDKEAKERALVLEMIGDIPDADVRPPENVLFVCKLNPVTKEDDLEVIFSRFGQINSCEVIRDSKTGESLQYAFIEFDRAEDCEKAYFKMDNVLIDDRRIHVDFSQSVSKLKWLGKGKGVIHEKDTKEKESRKEYSKHDKSKHERDYRNEHRKDQHRRDQRRDDHRDDRRDERRDDRRDDHRRDHRRDDRKDNRKDRNDYRREDKREDRKDDRRDEHRKDHRKRNDHRRDKDYHRREYKDDHHSRKRRSRSRS